MGNASNRTPFSVVWIMAGVTLVGLATWAVTAPLLTSGGFTLPMAGQPLPLWPPPNTCVPPVSPPPTGTKAAISIVNTGAPNVVVYETTGTTLASVASGDLFILEGDWASLQIEGAAANASATAYYRYWTGSMMWHGSLGYGLVHLGTGTTVACHANTVANPPHRLIAVEAPSSGPVQALRSDGTVLMAVTAGERTVASVSALAGFSLQGSGDARFWVHELVPQMYPCYGFASGNAGNTDSVVVDGTQKLTVKLRTPSGCAVQATWKVVGGTLQQTMVPQNQTRMIPSTGPDKLEQMSWTYQTGGTVDVEVTGIP